MLIEATDFKELVVNWLLANPEIVIDCFDSILSNKYVYLLYVPIQGLWVDCI